MIALIVHLAFATPQLGMRTTRLGIMQVDYEPFLKPGYLNMPTLDLKAINYSKFINKTHVAIELESECLRVTLLPALGRVYRIVNKETGHDILWRNDIARPGGANNKLGWWLWLGGIEYTLPGEEHGYTWALPWNWTVVEDSGRRKAVAATVVEPSTGLRERLVFSIDANRSDALRTDVEITNPSAEATAFAHWTNSPFVPGGTNELLDDTTLEVPTKEIRVAERWQANLGPSPQAWPSSPLHAIAGWAHGMGDFVAVNLSAGYFGAYSASADEGVLRLFDASATPGLDTWTYGYHPPRGDVPMGSGAASKGYAEMWGGNVRTFPDERAPIGGGERVGWTEYTLPFRREACTYGGRSLHPSLPPEVAASVCGSPRHAPVNTATRAARPLSRPRVDVKRGRFVLPDGREATFRGACVTESSGVQHVGGLVNVSEEVLGWIARQGLNTLRVGVHWSLYEPHPQEYNATYLAELIKLVRRMGKHGLWAIIDMHQDQWSEYYCAGHGIPSFYSQPPPTADYAAHGARAYPQPIAPSTFANGSAPMPEQMKCSDFMKAHHGSAVSLYTYALGAAAQRMYDEPALQRAFGIFWAAVATALRPLPNVLAFELINEPWYGDVKLERGPNGVDGWQLGQPVALSAPSLMRLHAALHAAIREVDDDTILLFEPGAGGAAYLEATNFTAGPGGEAYAQRQAFAYHQYCPDSEDAHQWGKAPPPASAAAAAQQIAACNASTRAMVAMRTRDAWLAGSGGAAIVTEFGQVNNDSVGVGALVAATEAFEAAGHSYTIWSVQLMNWLQIGGVPGYGERPEAPPANWLRPLARPYASAVGGGILEQRFDSVSGAFVLRFVAAADERVRRLPTIIHFSAELHYSKGLAFEAMPPVAGELAMSEGASGRLTFTPSAELVAGQRVEITLRSVVSDAPIELQAKHFSITIQPSTCNATMKFNRAAAGFPSQSSKTVGQPTPFLSLYNRVSDNRAQNMEACVGVSAIGTSGRSSSLLRVVAPHEYGFVDIAVSSSASGAALVFTAHNLSGWKGDAHEKHLSFGEWWLGLLDNSTAPIVMGKLQGPRAVPGPGALAGAPSAGFMTLSGRGYYKYLFYAEVGDAVAFTACPTPELAAIIRATAPASATPNPRRVETWYWSGSDFSEATLPKYADLALGVNASIVVAMEWDVNLATDPNRFPHGLKPVGDYLASRGLQFGLHMHPDIVYPCKGSLDGNFSNECLTSGVGVSPVVTSCPECMVPEGLAPTYRSGDPPNPGYSRSLWTEDLGFWWCHERDGATMCPNGNPKPCGQGSCNRYDWNMSWGSNLTLHGNYSWSRLGAYRVGGAAGFDGAPTTYGTVAVTEEIRGALTRSGGLTLGLVAHPVARAATGCLAALSGVFSLCLADGGTLEWAVRTIDGMTRAAQGRTPLTPGRGYVVKATYNTTSGAPLLFIDGKLDHPRAQPPDASSDASPKPLNGRMKAVVAGALSLAHASLASASAGAAIRFAVAFEGALEEIYLKNVSTENRVGYIYADNNRRAGTYLLDLSRDVGRQKFAELVAAPMQEAEIAAVQYDGFEKLALIAGQDFPHSSRTYQSGLYRGTPTPDWYHFEGWPLRWGLGVLQGMTAARDLMAAKLAAARIPAIEPSFMAPGLGPWRPDMAPYVDERGDLLDLGLEWHAKLLQRIELTGTLVNAYNSPISPLTTTTPFLADYWFGGLVSGGIAPQPRYGHTTRIPPNVTSAVRRWLQRYSRWGHTLEGRVHTLVYDRTCCHVQGDCEWIACDDAVLTVLTGGADGADAPSGGLILGSPLPVVVPPALLRSHLADGGSADGGGSGGGGGSGVRLVVFQTARVSHGLLTAGAPADRSLAIVLSSPVLNCTTTFRGGFFELGANETAVQVYLTLKDATGKTLSHRRIVGGGGLKPAEASFLFDRAREAPAQPPPLELLFEKVDVVVDALAPPSHFAAR